VSAAIEKLLADATATRERVVETEADAAKTANKGGMRTTLAGISISAGHKTGRLESGRTPRWL
jgi:hypothetical protein